MNYQFYNFDPINFNNYPTMDSNQNTDTKNLEGERILPFVGGALIGGLAGAAATGNRFGYPYGGGGYYYPTYSYPVYYPTYSYPYYYPYYPMIGSGSYYGFGTSAVPSTSTTSSTTTMR